MPKILSVENFIERSASLPIIDVRSPAEYEHAHIPGAFNLPLFDNDERAEVGTIYKQRGRVPAVQKGLEFVGPKLKAFTKYAQKLDSPELLVHCWRGGMRSSAMAWLLETIDLKCYLLEGGYKAYRNFVLNQFDNQYKIVLLGGPTGSGKTEILKGLHNQGEQVVDLESIANHKGSAFGSLGQNPQPSTEQFENNLAQKLLLLDKEKVVWMEDESRNIGRIPIPSQLWEQMRKSPLIMVDTSRDIRLERIMRDYALFPKEEISASIAKLEKRLGFDKCKFALEMSSKGDMAGAAGICLDYYDKAYLYQLHTRFGINLEGVHKVTPDSLEIKEDIITKIVEIKNNFNG